MQHNQCSLNAPSLGRFFFPSSCFQCQWQQKQTACYLRTRSPKYLSHTCFTRTWVFLNTCCFFFFIPSLKIHPSPCTWTTNENEKQLGSHPTASHQAHAATQGVAVLLLRTKVSSANQVLREGKRKSCVTGNDNSAAVMAKHKERSQGEKASCRLLTSVWMCVQITAGKIK